MEHDTVPELPLLMLTRSVLGEKIIGRYVLRPGDSAEVSDINVQRHGCPPPVKLEYGESGELTLIVWTNDGEQRPG